MGFFSAVAEKFSQSREDTALLMFGWVAMDVLQDVLTSDGWLHLFSRVAFFYLLARLALWAYLGRRKNGASEKTN